MQSRVKESSETDSYSSGQQRNWRNRPQRRLFPNLVVKTSSPLLTLASAVPDSCGFPRDLLLFLA